MIPLVIFLVGFFFTCQANELQQPGKQYTERFDAVRRDVGPVADVLVHLALGENNLTKTSLIAELTSVMDVQIHAMFVKLGEDITSFRKMTSPKNDNVCCQCKRCSRRCVTECGEVCCHGKECECYMRHSEYYMTLDAVKTPVRNLDDVIKNWGEESKEDLRRVVRSFFAARLAGSKSRCCLCLICNKSCPDVCTFLGFLDCCCEQRSSLCILCMPCIGENKALNSVGMLLLDNFIDKAASSLNEI